MGHNQQQDRPGGASPSEVAARVTPHVGGTRPVPERPARLTAVAAADAAPPPVAPAASEVGLTRPDPLTANPMVTDDVDDILAAVGPAPAGQPAVGVTVVMQHHSVAAQRHLMAQMLSWPTAYILFPTDRSSGALVTVRFSHRPQLRVSFRAVAVATPDERGMWALDGELSR